MDILDKFKEKLGTGNPVFGPFMKSTDPAFVEAAGYSGFDFVILDQEHGPVDSVQLQNLIRAAYCAGVLPVVRASDISESSISKPLDLGACGIQVPQVTNAEMARKCIKAARFFPEGERGVCRFVRAAQYSSMPREEYFKKANETLVIIQLEGKEAVLDLDNILRVDGIDIIFIGPYDLSQSLGVPGQVTHPVVLEAMNNIVGKARSAGKVVGTFTDTPGMAMMWKKAGVQYISYSVDVGIFSDACRNVIKSIK